MSRNNMSKNFTTRSTDGNQYIFSEKEDHLIRKALMEYPNYNSKEITEFERFVPTASPRKAAEGKIAGT